MVQTQACKHKKPTCPLFVSAFAFLPNTWAGFSCTCGPRLGSCGFRTERVLAHCAWPTLRLGKDAGSRRLEGGSCGLGTKNPKLVGGVGAGSPANDTPVPATRWPSSSWPGQRHGPHSCPKPRARRGLPAHTRPGQLLPPALVTVAQACVIFGSKEKCNSNL